MQQYILILLCCFVMTAHGQALRTQGQAIVNDSGDTVILRGMGLGGWMLQEGYMLQTSGFGDSQHALRNTIEALIGPANTQMFYDAWLANHVREIDIDSLKAWGFNSVRLPMHYNLYTLPIEEEPVQGEHTWLSKGFELTDSVIAWCARNEMYVVLDLHGAPGGQGQESSISDYDPSKPSLWESDLNKEKTVALWRRLAQRYVNEPWVAGYDLLNEPNWNLPNNTALRELYGHITDAIREVDTDHILFIEGNWFANDFTGLTPPWDDNMVYSPHKYWSFNNPGDIQWVLSLRNEFNVPLYFGEWGENSNTWFRDAVTLFEEHGIGWACWPMKKVESISGPLSVAKSPEYQALLDYWNGGGTTPTVEFATSALLDLADRFKIEHCIFQKDVIDAMFRQPRTDTTRPFRAQHIPGVVYATDFDLGPDGLAYSDSDVANYHVSTGNFTAWNQGWIYRNDGVDIEPCMDDVNTNGLNVGWINADEWMQYQVQVDSSAVYDVNVRVASNQAGGRFYLTADGAQITPPITVPPSGGWQNWQTVTVQDVILTGADQKLRFYCDNAGFNLSSLEFVYVAPSGTVDAAFVSAQTAGGSTVQLSVNKRLSAPLPDGAAGFVIHANGNPVEILSADLSEENRRVIIFEVGQSFSASDEITISYAGNAVSAEDGTNLTEFSMREVRNTIAIVHALPGRIEAEDFFDQSGIELEPTTDVGGGMNVGFLDPGDYMDYLISVPETRTYRVDYRTAALSETGRIVLQLIDGNGNAIGLHGVSFPPTGGWQQWETTSKTVLLFEGEHHLRVLIDEPLFNLNWIEFSFLTATVDPAGSPLLEIWPNPTNDKVWLRGRILDGKVVQVVIHDPLGRPVLDHSLQTVHNALDVSSLAAGLYYITVINESGARITRPFIRTDGI